MLTDSDLEKIGLLLDLKLHNALEPIYERIDRIEERMDQIERRMTLLEKDVREFRFDFNAITIN